MGNKLLRVGEAAQLLNVSRWTIYRWIEEGRLDATKIGKGSVRVFQESITRLIEENRQHGESVRPIPRRPAYVSMVR